MAVTVKVGFAPEITPRQGQFICRACCDRVMLDTCDNGCCVIAYCDKHPWVMIRDGKVVGTSA